MTTDFTSMPPEASDLVIRIMEANANQAASLTNSLVDSLTEQLADSQAEVDAIRARIRHLLDGPYMPTPDAIDRALCPSADDRAFYRRDGDS